MLQHKNYTFKYLDNPYDVKVEDRKKALIVVDRYLGKKKTVYINQELFESLFLCTVSDFEKIGLGYRYAMDLEKIRQLLSMDKTMIHLLFSSNIDMSKTIFFAIHIVPFVETHNLHTRQADDLFRSPSEYLIKTISKQNVYKHFILLASQSSKETLEKEWKAFAKVVAIKRASG